jgi:hypothetical protein
MAKGILRTGKKEGTTVKTWMGATVGVIAVLLLAGVALAQMGWGPMGPGGMGWGQMGPGMMGGWQGGYGQAGYGCPGMGWGMGPGMMGGTGGTAPQPLTDDKAKELAQQYADKYLSGFTVERVLPFAGMGMTMYQAELKGPNNENRVLHINPWGNVMPFGGPWRRG